VPPRRLRLHTPGHGPILDALILYGLIEGVVVADPYAEVEVRPYSWAYEIEVETDAGGAEVGRAAAETLLSDLMVVEVLSPGNEITLELSELSKFVKANLPQRSQLGTFLRRMKEAADQVAQGLFDPFKEYSDVEHALNRKEGRGSKKGKLTAHIPISGIYGKYVGSSFKAEAKGYHLCPLCSTLAWVGMVNYVPILSYFGKGETSVTYIVPQPTIPVEDVTALLALKDVADTRRMERVLPRLRNVKVPAIAAPLVVLAVGETTAALSDVGLIATVYEYGRAGGGYGVRTYGSVPLDRLLRFIEAAKLRSDKLTRLIQALIRTEEVGALAVLAETVAFGGLERAYGALRTLRAALWQAERRDEEVRNAEVLLDEQLVEAILETTYT